MNAGPRNITRAAVVGGTTRSSRQPALPPTGRARRCRGARSPPGAGRDAGARRRTRAPAPPSSPGMRTAVRRTCRRAQRKQRAREESAADRPLADMAQRPGRDRSTKVRSPARRGASRPSCSITPAPAARTSILSRSGPDARTCRARAARAARVAWCESEATRTAPRSPALHLVRNALGLERAERGGDQVMPALPARGLRLRLGGEAHGHRRRPEHISRT